MEGIRPDEVRARLADCIDEQRDEIQRRWQAQVREELRLEHLSSGDLRDAIPDYLVHLGAALRGTDALAEAGEAGWKRIAREHAVTRVRLGFDIEKLVQEFFILRRVLFRVMCEKTEVGPAATQDAALATLIESAVATAVRTYVEARDYESRRLEAQHIGFVTHELRNPLSVVSLGLRQLRRFVPESEEPQVALSRVEKGLTQLSALVERVLTAGTLEAGEAAQTRREVEFGPLFEEAIRGAQATADSKGIGLVVDVRRTEGAVLDAVPELAISAMQNVLDNAVKFTDEGQVEVTADDRGERVAVTVRDNCSGLSSEELRTLFEPFKRGRTGKPGSGLGLAIARRAMEASGGEIHAESGEERGCVFTLTFLKAKH